MKYTFKHNAYKRFSINISRNIQVPGQKFNVKPKHKLTIKNLQLEIDGSEGCCVNKVRVITKQQERDFTHSWYLNMNGIMVFMFT